jgi:hypothetical protein
MTSEERESEKMDNAKANILIFLPAMKELEAMGYDPVKVMTGKPSFVEIEATYVALTRAKAKYPQWYKEVSAETDKMMINLKKQVA